MRKAILIFCFTLLAQLPGIGQGQFALHLDKPFYTTGEDIWYQLYIPAAVDQTVAIKGIIVSPSGMVLDRFFQKAEKGTKTLDGFFKIPFEYQSGVYRIEFRATADPAAPEVVLAQKEFPLYNDFQIKELAEQMERAPKAMTAEAADASMLKIDIALDKATYTRRGEVKAALSVVDAAGNPVEADYSLSVIDANIVSDAIGGTSSYAIGPVLNQNTLANLKGDIFMKGMLSDTLNNPIQANVLGAYASVQKRILYGKTAPGGFFTFKMPDFYGEQTLQFIGYPKEEEEIRVKLVPEVTSADKPQQSLPISESILSYLEASQQKKKMAEYFEDIGTQIEMEDYENKFEGLKADFSYDADEYVKFETVGDFFSELITPLKFRIVKGVYQARMENPRARDASFNNLPGKPIFIIDGKFTRDANFIARTNWANVKSVDIFYFAEKLRKQFNILGQGGVVRIETDIPQFVLPPNDLEDVFSVKGLKPKGSFMAYTPSIKTGDTRLPSFNTPTYWAPQGKTNARGEASMTFFQGDDESTFEVQVFAKTADGRVGFATKRFTVQ